MSETPNNDASVEQLPQSTTSFDTDETQERWEDAEKLREAYTQWLERREIDPASVPRFLMKRREFNLFRNAGIGSANVAQIIYKTRSDYDIPLDTKYAWIDLEPATPDLPVEPALVKTDENDFGTVITGAAIAFDFENPSGEPDDPNKPGNPTETYHTADISNAIAATSHSLYTLAAELMEKKTVDPFSGGIDNYGIRAGDIFEGQKDAYVWTSNPFTRSVELTVAFPTMYNSVCVVSGEKREAENGKAGMAQIDNPTVILKIEGEDLEKLKSAYQQLYSEPYFAVSEEQNDRRDTLFNMYFMNLISQTAQRNKSYEQTSQYTRPRLMERKLGQ